MGAYKSAGMSVADELPSSVAVVVEVEEEESSVFILRCKSRKILSFHVLFYSCVDTEASSTLTSEEPSSVFIFLGADSTFWEPIHFINFFSWIYSFCHISISSLIIFPPLLLLSRASLLFFPY